MAQLGTGTRLGDGNRLTAAGIPHVFNIYQGAHDRTFWRERQDEWLAAAVERLDPPERSGS